MKIKIKIVNCSQHTEVKQNLKYKTAIMAHISYILAMGAIFVNIHIHINFI